MKIAKRNIVVYKEFWFDGEVLRAPIHRIRQNPKSWGKPIPGKILKEKKFDPRPVVCSQGIHAWKYQRNNYHGLGRGNQMWVCVIPEGASYYMCPGEDKIRSSKLILVKEVGLDKTDG